MKQKLIGTILSTFIFILLVLLGIRNFRKDPTDNISLFSILFFTVITTAIITSAVVQYRSQKRARNN